MFSGIDSVSRGMMFNTRSYNCYSSIPTIFPLHHFFYIVHIMPLFTQNNWSVLLISFDLHPNLPLSSKKGGVCFGVKLYESFFRSIYHADVIVEYVFVHKNLQFLIVKFRWAYLIDFLFLHELRNIY